MDVHIAVRIRLGRGGAPSPRWAVIESDRMKHLILLAALLAAPLAVLHGAEPPAGCAVPYLLVRGAGDAGGDGDAPGGGLG